MLLSRIYIRGKSMKVGHALICAASFALAPIAFKWPTHSNGVAVAAGENARGACFTVAAFTHPDVPGFTQLYAGGRITVGSGGAPS